MNRVIRWEDPSYVNRGRKPGVKTPDNTRWAETLTELKERPGEWA